MENMQMAIGLSVLIVFCHHTCMKCMWPKWESAANLPFHFWNGILLWSSLKCSCKIKLPHKTERQLSSLTAQLQCFRG